MRELSIKFYVAVCATRKPMPFPMLMVILNHFSNVVCLSLKRWKKTNRLYILLLSFFILIAKVTGITTTMAIIMCELNKHFQARENERDRNGAATKTNTKGERKEN